MQLIIDDENVHFSNARLRRNNLELAKVEWKERGIAFLRIILIVDVILHCWVANIYKQKKS